MTNGLSNWFNPYSRGKRKVNGELTLILFCGVLGQLSDHDQGEKAALIMRDGDGLQLVCHRRDGDGYEVISRLRPTLD